MKRQLMAEQWSEFAAKVLPAGCAREQKQEMRRVLCRCTVDHVPGNLRICAGNGTDRRRRSDYGRPAQRIAGLCEVSSNKESLNHKYDREMEVIRISAKVGTLEPTRDERQAGVGQWCVDAFGSGHASSIPQRGLRNVEEAIETAQSAGCERSMVHQLVDHVFDHPPGALNQEIGGQGLTLLALAQAAKLSADAEEAREFARVLSKPLSWFHERNQAKNEAGFDVSAYPVSAPPVALTASSQCDGCGGTRTTYVGEDGTRGTYPKPCPKCCVVPPAAPIAEPGCESGHHMYRVSGYDAGGQPYYRCEDCGSTDPEGDSARIANPFPPIHCGCGETWTQEMHRNQTIQYSLDHGLTWLCAGCGKERCEFK